MGTCSSTETESIWVCVGFLAGWGFPEVDDPQLLRQLKREFDFFTFELAQPRVELAAIR